MRFLIVLALLVGCQYKPSPGVLPDDAAPIDTMTDGARLLAAIHEREKIMSTGIGLGIAIPHAKIPSVKDFVVGFAKIDQGIDFNSLDGKPVHFVVMIAGPDHQQERYLQLLARITLKLKDAAVRRRWERETISGALNFGVPSLHLAAHELPFGGVGPSGTGAYHC